MLHVEVQALTAERFADLVELFSRRGLAVARNCFCMCYRRTGKQQRPSGMTHAEANRRALKALVARGVVPGLIGYANGRAVGWISLGPREDYPRLERSPVMKPVDDKPVWSVICFVVDPAVRGRGVAAAMLEAATAWARSRQVRLLEAYPCDKPGRAADDSMCFGAKSMFERAGFVEVARRKPARPVVRKKLRAPPRAER